jgi:hypothetical protein
MAEEFLGCRKTIIYLFLDFILSIINPISAPIIAKINITLMANINTLNEKGSKSPKKGRIPPSKIPPVVVIDIRIKEINPVIAPINVPLNVSLMKLNKILNYKYLLEPNNS